MENILQIKLKLEEQAKITYSNARSKLTKEEEALHLLEETLASYQEEQRRSRLSRLDLIKIRRTEDAVEVMLHKAKQQKIAVSNAEKRLEIARIRLNDAVVERKTQERLKEKAWDEYMLEFEAEERKEVDELTSYVFSNPVPGEEDR